MDKVRLEIDVDNVAWIVFDDPAARVNLLGPAAVSQLDSILDSLTAKKPKGVVIISDKPDTFIAGADIKELDKIRDAHHATELARAGQKVFQKLEDLGVPTVAAIDGACLGGGCELALACRARVASDSPKTQIGLPETQLGIFPGWGGTQRLPRLIGTLAALDIIVPGQSVRAEKALKIGLVDAVVPPIALRETAKKMALGMIRPRRASTFWKNFRPIRAIICRKAREQVLARTRGHYPAPLRAIDALQQGLSKWKVKEGFEVEAALFGQVAATSQCKNLIRVFFLREKYSKMRLGDGSGPVVEKKMQKVGVIGAGLMGAGIAQWCSARGLTVRLKDIKPEYVASGMKRIADVYAEGVKRRRITPLEAQQGLARVHPTTDYSGFSDCDLVIEAVLEKIEIKEQVFSELVPLLRPDCVIASNTSAIRIDGLAAASGQPKRFVGIHFFNPVHKMPLIEIVRGTNTSYEVVAAAVEFVKQLKKIPVIVRGEPGFLVNRLLMPYLNEAGVLLNQGCTIEAIDRAMLDFGMPMGPLRLIDEVGIDIAFDVAGELAAAFKDRMTVAPILSKLHDAKLKGRKAGEGFYVYNGRVEKVNPRVKEIIGNSKCALPDEEIQKRLLGVMIAEAKLCLKEGIVESEDDVDVGMIFGTGFPPFRGGLIKYARDLSPWPATQRRAVL